MASIVTQDLSRVALAPPARRHLLIRLAVSLTALLCGVVTAAIVSIWFPWTAHAPYMLGNGLGGGYGAPFASAGEGVAFGYPLTSPTGPYRVRVTGVRLIAEGDAPVPRLLDVGLTPEAALAHASSCDVLMGCSQFEGAWQYWPPREVLGPHGTVIHVPILGLDRQIVIGNVPASDSWSLVVNVLGPRPNTTYRFQVAISVLWRGQASEQLLPMDGWVPTGAGSCHGTLTSPNSACA